MAAPARPGRVTGRPSTPTDGLAYFTSPGFTDGLEDGLVDGLEGLVLGRVEGLVLGRGLGLVDGLELGLVAFVEGLDLARDPVIGVL
ncbi:MAG: hypothetical protein ACI9FG_001469 [Crocinitomicaceae bacterium]